MAPWFRPFDPSARVHLVYLPFAGGGANEVRPWASGLPEDVALAPALLPGRETRFREPAARSMEELVGPLTEALATIPGPYVIFGHSMGSWLGFEAVRRLRATGRKLPEMLVVSARRAPGMPDRWPPMHRLEDDALIDTIQARYGAIPPQVAAERGLLGMFLPTLRADLEVVETWEYQTAEPLPVPLVAFYGTEDSVSEEEIEGWAPMSRHRFRRRAFAGGHFYFRGPNPEFLQELSLLLEEVG